MYIVLVEEGLPAAPARKPRSLSLPDRVFSAAERPTLRRGSESDGAGEGVALFEEAGR